MEDNKGTDTEGSEANEAGAPDDAYAPRFRKIDAIFRGLHETALDVLNPGSSENTKNLAGATMLAHGINALGVIVLALTEIAEAQQKIAAIVQADYENNKPTEVNPNPKMVRNPIGKGRQSPLTRPE